MKRDASGQRSVVSQQAIVCCPYDDYSPACHKLIAYASVVQQSFKHCDRGHTDSQPEDSGWQTFAGCCMEFPWKSLHTLHTIGTGTGCRSSLFCKKLLMLYHKPLYNQSNYRFICDTNGLKFGIWPSHLQPPLFGAGQLVLSAV